MRSGPQHSDGTLFSITIRQIWTEVDGSFQQHPVSPYPEMATKNAGAFVSGLRAFGGPELGFDIVAVSKPLPFDTTFRHHFGPLFPMI
jgi:hypothetical protein